MHRQMEENSVILARDVDPPHRAAPPAPANQTSLFKIFYRRWLTIAAACLVCILVAVIYLLRATSMYTSNSRICVDQNVQKILTDNNQGGESTPYDSYLFTQSEVVNSVPILAEALLNPEVANAKFLKGVRNPITFLKSRLDVQLGKKDEIITVSFDAPDPNEAAALVNAVVNAYVSYESRVNHSTSTTMLKVLNSEKDLHEAELSKQQDALLTFKQANGDAFLQTDHGNIVMTDFETISAELTRAKIQATQMAADYAVSNSRKAAEELLNRANARVKNLQSIYNQAEQRAVDLNSKTSQYARLQSDVDRTNRLLDLLDTRIKQLSVTGDSGALNISILEAAQPDETPSKPRRKLLLAAALAAGLMIGAGAAIVREQLDQRIRTVEDVGNILGVRVLGVVPSIRKSAIGGPRDRPRDRHSQLQLDPNSPGAEAYRSIQTSLHFGLLNRGAKTVLVTSASSGDGKSTTASNLAIALARAGRRTLLIDADFRVPSLHELFGIHSKVGFGDVLVNDAPVESCIVPTEVDRLDLLPCGPISFNSADALNSIFFQEFLGNLAEKYDQIILDSSPLLTFADARILGAMCDATIVVVRSERTTRRHAEHARSLLESVDAQIIGAILNDVSRSYDLHNYRYGMPRYSVSPVNGGIKVASSISRAIGKLPDPTLPKTEPSDWPLSRRQL